MSARLLYRRFAQYYDLLHSDKDYRREVARLVMLIRRFKLSSGRDLLDVACGTGRHLSFFKRRFRCVGVDLHPAMLRVARSKVPGVRFVRGDMRSFRLGTRFDVVTCLYSSITYVRTVPKLRSTIANFVHHLKPGGVLLIEPYFTPGSFKPGSHITTRASRGVTITRIAISRRRGNFASRKSVTVVAAGGGDLALFRETRNAPLFTGQQMLSAMRAAGLRAHVLRIQHIGPWGLYVGVKPGIQPPSTVA